MFRFVKNLIKYPALFSVVVVISAITFVSSASAITLIPPSLELGLTPGQPTTTMIKLYNETQDTVQLFTDVRNFTAKGETGQPTFDFNAEPTGLSEWIEIEDGPIVLAPGERSEIPATINPPADADPGGHYATIFFGTNPPEEGQVTIGSKIGTLILGRVAGEVIEGGSIAEFDVADGKTMFNRLPIEFYTRFENSGNVHLRPTGSIVISDMFNKDVDTIEVNASKGATLPKTIRKYEAVWERAQLRGTQGNFWTRFKNEYLNERDNFALGKFTAAVSVHAGTNSIDDAATVSFWVLPWHVLLVWAVVAVIGVILLIMLLKRYNAWIRKKSQK